MKIKKSAALKWAALMVIVLVSLATIYSLKTVDRFYVKTEQLLTDGKFLEGVKHWKESGSEQVSFSGNEITIATNPGASHSVSQNVPIVTPAFVRFSFEAKTSNIVGGEKVWARASGTIIYRDKEGKRVGSRSIAFIDGSTVVKTYSYTDLLKEHLGSVDISFRLLHAGGSFSVRNPTLSLLDEFPFYKNLRIALAIIWMSLFGAFVFFAVKLMGRVQIVAVLLLGLGVLAGALIPVAAMSAINHKIVVLMPASLMEVVRYLLAGVFGLETLANAAADVSKLGHFLAFVLIGGLAGWSYRQIGLLFGVASVSVFALATESLQVFVNGRTPGISDLMIDISGGLLGVAIGVGCFMVAQQIKRLLASGTIAATAHNNKVQDT